MGAQDGLAMLRGQLADIIAGTFFLLVGLTAFSIVAIRRGSGARILLWLGIWSGLVGVNLLVQSSAFVAAIAPSFQPLRIPILVTCSYLTLVAAALACLELAVGALRRLMLLWVVAAAAIGLAGIGWFFVSGAQSSLIVYNQMLAVVGLVIIITSLLVPALSKRFLLVSRHHVLTAGTLIFVVEALCANVARVLHYPVPNLVNSLGFAVLLLCFGYVSLEMIVVDERRLLSIDKELEIARQLQFSTLPASVPEFPNLRIAASYLPMTAVAGDFYDFVAIDERNIGFLVADVSGHGVAAALIASMIKVAMHAVTTCAQDPSEVLRRLGGTLYSELRGQLVSTAYLCLDSQSLVARYSAAGHPPLLLWRASEDSLIRIESNGLLFGVQPDCDYPTCEVALASGDRLLIYTDGFTEAENAAGEPFADHRLEQALRNHPALSAADLSQCLLAELRSWQPAGVAQQDDITLIVIDVDTNDSR